jgi:disulfide bond formation protein DsbB
MPLPSLRVAALLATLLAAASLGGALASEYWGGLVPCALCLLERWPFRIAIVLGLLALVTPPRVARLMLGLMVLTMLADAAIAFVHIGVEFRWWRSPLPECAAPRFSGGSIADRLASMPMHPAKPCDEPTFLIPFLPISMAMMNLWFGLACAAALTWFLSFGGRRRA